MKNKILLLFAVASPFIITIAFQNCGKIAIDRNGVAVEKTGRIIELKLRSSSMIKTDKYLFNTDNNSFSPLLHGPTTNDLKNKEQVTISGFAKPRGIDVTAAEPLSDKEDPDPHAWETEQPTDELQNRCRINMIGTSGETIEVIDSDFLFCGPLSAEDCAQAAINVCRASLRGWMRAKWTGWHKNLAQTAEIKVLNQIVQGEVPLEEEPATLEGGKPAEESLSCTEVEPPEKWSHLANDVCDPRPDTPEGNIEQSFDETFCYGTLSNKSTGQVLASNEDRLAYDWTPISAVPIPDALMMCESFEFRPNDRKDACLMHPGETLRKFASLWFRNSSQPSVIVPSKWGYGGDYECQGKEKPLLEVTPELCTWNEHGLCPGVTVDWSLGDNCEEQACLKGNLTRTIGGNVTLACGKGRQTTPVNGFKSAYFYIDCGNRTIKTIKVRGAPANQKLMCEYYATNPDEKYPLAFNHGSDEMSSTGNMEQALKSGPACRAIARTKAKEACEDRQDLARVAVKYDVKLDGIDYLDYPTGTVYENCKPPQGCHKVAEGCGIDSECCGGLVCNEGLCGTTPACKAEGLSCTKNSHCCSGLSCNNGLCSNLDPVCKASGLSCSSTSECCGSMLCGGDKRCRQPSGSLSASPGNCTVMPGKQHCSSTLSYTANAACPTPCLFSGSTRLKCGGSSFTASGIPVGNKTFRLRCSSSASSPLLASKTVQGSHAGKPEKSVNSYQIRYTTPETKMSFAFNQKFSGGENSIPATQYTNIIKWDTDFNAWCAANANSKGRFPSKIQGRRGYTDGTKDLWETIGSKGSCPCGKLQNKCKFNSDCCSGQCSGQKCVNNSGPTCKNTGGPCTSNNQCCPGKGLTCNVGVCWQNFSCVGDGGSCLWNKDCCGGFCDQGRGMCGDEAVPQRYCGYYTTGNGNRYPTSGSFCSTSMGTWDSIETNFETGHKGWCPNNKGKTYGTMYLYTEFSDGKNQQSSRSVNNYRCPN